MSETMFRMFELAQQGFSCSQILLQLGLDAQGKSNEDLLRAMAGLAGGMGFSGETCGALTGGACLLGLYAADHERFQVMVAELVDWFKAQGTSAYGGFTCGDILGEELQYQVVSVKCGEIVTATYDKVREILLNYGIDLAEGSR
ncbi:DVU_1555 family C-GCAxxG-C-C protein [Desulforamulus aeronauticus]|uniref:C_GCAxxG_C_C family probable redox protein n=1 Tax=Desulforamulus aeronauticus DSM 10349 TaxID=1121421 RepID=A0A1M6S102_9FIRM|nr:DV_1555 family C-GCAxxG-C-C protein [Desulforamulus aeronauticus]SHK38365.1 C_GCAxxG_C_C family probable redox protein [Desulforamulus aeronauticus DSM 10349]